MDFVTGHEAVLAKRLYKKHECPCCSDASGGFTESKQGLSEISYVTNISKVNQKSLQQLAEPRAVACFFPNMADFDGSKAAQI